MATKPERTEPEKRDFKNKKKQQGQEKRVL